MDRKEFDSSVPGGRLQVKAPYYNAINPTTVFFVQEDVSACVNSMGHVEFFDAQNRSLGFVDFPVDKDPSKYGHTAQYGEMECTAGEGVITFFLPKYDWDDSYPHCDGESDRWSRYITGWFRVVFDCAALEIAVLDR